VVEPVAAAVAEALVVAVGVVVVEEALAWDQVESVYAPVVEQRFPINPVRPV